MWATQRWQALGVWGVLIAAPVGAVEIPRFLRFEEVREVCQSFAGTGLGPKDPPDNRVFDAWIRDRDREIRGRIDRGAEDSISNLILYGTSFTTLPRIEGPAEALVGGQRLSAAARARVQAFAEALSNQPQNEHLSFAADFFAHRGMDHGSLQVLLETNLSRLAAEQRSYQSALASASADEDQRLMARSTLFRERGLSADTSLLPNFAIEDTLRAMMRKGALAPGAIRRVAIIGPGLDFADKRDGYDYYPPQTIQPFAVLEAVARLGLGAADQVEITAFDLNPAVLTHIRSLSQRVRKGQAYTIQLPRNAHAGWNSDAFGYWQHFGEIIGSPVAPIAVPSALQHDVVARAVAIQPRFAAHLEVVDVDIVAQTIDPEPGRGFDLVVATNILLYYDLFHQALAKAAIGRMMNPGGVLLANHTLPSEPSSILKYLGRRSLSYSSNGAFGDDVVAYRRKEP